MSHTLELKTNGNIIVNCGAKDIHFVVDGVGELIQQSHVFNKFMGKECPGCGESLMYILFGMDD